MKYYIITLSVVFTFFLLTIKITSEADNAARLKHIAMLECIKKNCEYENSFNLKASLIRKIDKSCNNLIDMFNDKMPLHKIGNTKNEKLRVSKVNPSDITLLSMLIMTECSMCNYEEKMWIAQVVKNRVRLNYNGYGCSYKEQIFAPAQFSGAVKLYSDSLKWCHLGKNDPLISDKFYFDPEIAVCRENFNVAYDVLERDIDILPCNTVYFCNPSISTNSQQVNLTQRHKVAKGLMIYATSSNYKCP